jgi:hypothetical protein
MNELRMSVHETRRPKVVPSEQLPWHCAGAFAAPACCLFQSSLQKNYVMS